MTLFSSPFLRQLPRLAFARFALVCALAVPCSNITYAADEPVRELEESTRTALEKLQPLVDAKNWDAALSLISGLRAKAKPESFDMALLTDIEAKILLQKGDYPKVIAPWETTLRLTDKHNYLSPANVQDIVYYLAQIYYQEATSSKVPAVQKQHFAKAVDYLKRWMANTERPDRDPTRQEAQLFYANVLYNQAVIDANNIDMELLSQSEAEVQKALQMSARPKDTLYLILLAITQQKGDMVRLAELLELLVKMTPAKQDYWAQLAGVYLNLANDEKDPRQAKEYNTRAILAIERAQALGFMKTPKENYTLVGIYFNVGQFGRATEILHAGLGDGSIESKLENWELLIYSYQQVDRPLQAVEAAKEGAKKFPESGRLEYQAAQIYYSLNQPEESYKLLEAAIDKGGFEKPAAVYGFLAYVCWELNKLEEAAAAVDQALSFPDGKSDQQLPGLKRAIEDKIRDRDADNADSKTASL